jgi:hypothetical protein
MGDTEYIVGFGTFGAKELLRIKVTDPGIDSHRYVKPMED